MKHLKGIERLAKRLVPRSWRKNFRASRYEVLMDRLAPVDLIVHVGAHWAEDADFYEARGASTILWIEADPDTFAELNTRLQARTGTTRHLSECALVSATGGQAIEFHRFGGDGASSSVHRASQTLKARFPGVTENGEVLELATASLPALLQKHDIVPETFERAMLVVDVQGHEFEVLKGLAEALEQFALCKCEVSRLPFYVGGATFEQIDEHMQAHGFTLASHRRWRVPRHGDVLYLRK